MNILILGCKEYPYRSEVNYGRHTIGGSLRYISDLVNSLAEKNILIHLITQKFPNQRDYEYHENVNVYRVQYISGKFFQLPTFALLSFMYSLQLCKKKKIDLIHGHSLFAIFFGFLLGKITNTPVVGTSHGLSGSHWPDILLAFLRWGERNIYSNLDALILFSTEERHRIEKILDVKFHNVVILASGIKPRKNHSQHLPRDNSSSFKVVFTGRLVPIKAINNLIKSATHLPREIRSEIKYLIVGDGYEKENLEKLTKELRLDNVVSFEGFHSDVYPYLNAADIFILPSYSEGFPISLLEAMSVGLPCITNDFGLSISNNAVYLIPNNNPETIAKAIIELYHNKSLQKELGKNAIKIVTDRFSFDRVVREHIELYEKLCGIKI